MIKILRFSCLLVFVFLLVACGGDNPAPGEPPAGTSNTATADPTTPAGATPSPAATSAAPEATATGESSAEEAAPAAPERQITYFPDSDTAALALAEDGTLYLALGQHDQVLVTASADGGESFSEPVQANGVIPAINIGVEGPSLATGEEGVVHVAWLQAGSGMGRTPWEATSHDGGQSFSDPVQASMEADVPHLFLPRLARDPAGELVAAWLADGELVVTYSEDDGASFQAEAVVDEQVCDCCPPAPVFANGGEALFVAYRNLEYDEQRRPVRDIYVLQPGSEQEPVRVSDEPWHLNSCPVDGPSLAMNEEIMVVGWIDGRLDEGASTRTDVWVATSHDGGQSFSENVRVNTLEGPYHSTVQVALGPGGRIHLVWSAFEAEQNVLYYAWSDDNGHTFSEPEAVATNQRGSGQGRPIASELLVGEDGRIYLLWVDATGAYLGTWMDV